ncbi:alkaline phosphatase D family protein [Flocculibacter collagenilyticus]|uniref:alkaline phosphatase D family protein n=1 Tax=Flocculibacter collagenilyticus TaxID=2744479 RepID=UPI0018F71762|nr:alkaline phosphatase D family protein [Flocculibacter collagenilyticus]
MANSPIICGPFLRHCSIEFITVWFVSRVKAAYVLELIDEQDDTFSDHQEFNSISLGEELHICNIKMHVPKPLHNTPESKTRQFHYQLYLQQNEQLELIDFSQLAFDNDNQALPRVMVSKNVQLLLHGSCRKPHHPSKDTFAAIDNECNERIGKAQRLPDYLIMSGDQVYGDDVAGPMLVAIHALIKKLKFYSEALPESAEVSLDMLLDNQYLYGRHSLLPHYDFKKWAFFKKSEPIISSLYRQNHLITLSEFIALYLLTWSSACWELIWDDVCDKAKALPKSSQSRYKYELSIIESFKNGLASAQRVMANVPSVMMFDDHDITDDWNLSAQWESRVYGHALTRQAIANGLAAYALFQDWGNQIDQFNQDWLVHFKALEKKKTLTLAETSDLLLDYDKWHFELNTHPTIIMLDTRTHRWRSEGALNNPSGLMDWESLCELEEQITSEAKSVIIVSPAPILGVKLIEVIQKVFAMVGKELLVDVENWMAHPGTAKKILSMMLNTKSPDEIIVLSGDVHYSFCFSANERLKKDNGKIWQLTASGIKNEFPAGLLKVLDKLNRFLYARKSFFNLFTRRRKLAIKHHKSTDKTHSRLFGTANIGMIHLHPNGTLANYTLLQNTGEKTRFILGK